jgi:hypothetical protein
VQCSDFLYPEFTPKARDLVDSSVELMIPAVSSSLVGVPRHGRIKSFLSAELKHD